VRRYKTVVPHVHAPTAKPKLAAWLTDMPIHFPTHTSREAAKAAAQAKRERRAAKHNALAARTYRTGL
jgi:hypothetical protein